MAVVNQQLEDTNNHGTGGGTSSMHEIARVNASNETEMERVTRLYLESMRRLIRVNQSEDHNNSGEGGSTSSLEDLSSVFTLPGAEMEHVISICKETLSPMICEINANHQNIASVIKEIFGFDWTGNFGNRPSTSGSSPAFQFRFLNGISTPVYTGMNIEGKDHTPFVVALVDEISGQIVSIGDEAAMEIELVVLEGDYNDVEAEYFSSDEFNSKIVREWKGKKVVQGKTCLKLKEGIVCIDKVSFTHNSTWKGNRIYRLGAKSKDAVFATRVKEAKTESFLVKDKRNLLYIKHPIPSFKDPVYRLHMISRRSPCFIRLTKANIKTVMDLRALHAINPTRLQDILEVHPNTWKTIINHADKCKDDYGIYLYRHPRDDQRRDGVVFNVSGQLVGLVANSQFLPSDKLPGDKKADSQKLIVSASEHWEQVVSFNDEASLINHLKSRPTLITFPNALNLVIPHTSFTTPPTSPSENNNIAGQSSQSPKRPASEHTLSNSPKKPRDNHQQISIFTPNAGTSRMTNTKATSEVTTDDDEYLQYLNLSQYDKWKMLWCVAGWISIFSKVRKRQMTLDNDTVIAIAASVEQVQI